MGIDFLPEDMKHQENKKNSHGNEEIKYYIPKDEARVKLDNASKPQPPPPHERDSVFSNFFSRSAHKPKKKDVVAKVNGALSKAHVPNPKVMIHHDHEVKKDTFSKKQKLPKLERPGFCERRRQARKKKAQMDEMKRQHSAQIEREQWPKARQEPVVTTPRPKSVSHPQGSLQYHEPEMNKRGSGNDLDVNLATKDLLVSAKKANQRRVAVLVFSLLLSCTILAAGYFYVTYSGSQLQDELIALDDQSEDLTLQLDVYQDSLREIVVLQKQLMGLTELVSHHRYWSNVLTFLEDYTVTDVYFTDFIVTDENEVVLSAVAPNYNTISKQMTSFELAKKEISDVSVLSANVQESREIINDLEIVKKEIHFDITLTFNPEFI